MVGWFGCWIVGQSITRLLCLLDGKFVGWFVACLDGWLVGSLVGGLLAFLLH